MPSAVIEWHKWPNHEWVGVVVGAAGLALLAMWMVKIWWKGRR